MKQAEREKEEGTPPPPLDGSGPSDYGKPPPGSP